MPESQTVIASAIVQVRVPAGTPPASLEPLVLQTYTLLQQAGLPIIRGTVGVQGNPITHPIPVPST